jgi:hypothetical protein
MNRVSRTSFSAGLVALLLLLVNPALAQSEAGRILFSRGVVSIVGAEDSARGGKTGDVIYEGERVETGRNGIAQLRLSDGALIALRASSNYHIQRQGYDVQGNVYEQTGQLVAGWMRMVTGAIGTRYPGNVKQGTNVATIGIRGTTFQVIHIPEGGLPGYPDTAPGTYLMLEEGSIEVTTDGGKRLLQPGDVIFVSSKDAPPQLAPDKKGLFLNVPDGDASYVDLEESDFADFTNETLVDTLLSPRPFTLSAAVGLGTAHNWTFSYSTQSEMPVSFTTSGSGSGRIMTSLNFFPDGDFLLEALTGAKPDSTGYYLLSDGSEINWGVWGSPHYTSSQLNEVSGVYEDMGNDGRDWHYMMASNVMDPSKVVSSLTGEATFNWVGGTNFMVNGVTTSNQITGGSVLVNFLTQNMNFDLATNFTTNNLNNSDCSSAGCSIFDFYNGGISIGDQAGFSGSIGGAFVGDGTGIISYIEVWDDGSNDVYHGTAAFSGNPEPFVGEPNPGP